MKLGKQLFKKALEKIIQIRVVEENISKEFKKNKVLSFLHLSIGQEACAVGVALACKAKDNFFGNHRSHAHYLAKGGNLEKMIYEIFGDKRGCCKGVGGSMHMLDKKVNFLGSVPILGSSLPIASGIALAEKKNNSKKLTVVFIGDGSAEEGSFYETINLAGLYKIPLLVVIEDNKYAVESDNSKRKVNGYSLKGIVKNGLNTLYKRVDGQDFKKIYKTSLELRQKILKNKCVAVLHLDCLRFAKHSGHEISYKDQNSKYRKNEYKEIKNKDPIQIIKKDLFKLGISKKELLEQSKLIKLKYNSKFYKTFNDINLRKI